MKRVLITGGGGFIGRNVARVLRKLGHEVFSPTHQELDLTNIEQCVKFVSEHTPEAIIHTAFRGHFGSNNQHDDFVQNMEMYNTLTWLDDYVPTIIIGSGAEYDRRLPIEEVTEEEVYKQWPMDLYGLSKNIITRRAMGQNCVPGNEPELYNPCILRLFGCFGSDEPDFRFIKRSIIRLKQGLPIEIRKDKVMDFFFVDDVGHVIDFILDKDINELYHANLVYWTSFEEKLKLSNIANIICRYMNVSANIEIKEEGLDMEYTGDGFVLANSKISLIGLHNGIKKMIEELT
jgi:nucleoside-diphosphate-sugar epimerase